MLANCSSLLSFTGNGVVFLCLFIAPGVAQTQDDALQQHVRENPHDFRANNGLGEFYAHRGNYRAAVRYLHIAYTLKPDDDSNAFDLAQAELQAGDAAGARSFVQALLSRKDRPELRNLLGDCEEALGNFREGAAQYQIAARADPSEPNLFSFGSALLKHGAYRDAAQILAYAVGQYPKSPRVRVALGVAQYSLGDYRSAVGTFCNAVDLNPDDARAFEFLGKMVGVAPELASQVSERLRQFAASYPNNPSANYYYAMTLLGEPNASRDSVRHLLERAVSESPTFAEAHYQLGIVCDEQGDTPRAVTELQNAVRLKPDWKSAHYRLAQFYRKTGQPELAEREFHAVRNAREQ
jgi:tetratricopeptide (TPR) repeat protein